jgi:flagellar motility protein MotE (MotC chaperone)
MFNHYKKRPTDFLKNPLCSIMLFVLCFILFASLPVPAYGQDDMIRFIENKQKELKSREEFIDQEDKKLNALKKDVEIKIEKYTKLLNELDTKLREIEKIKNERLDYIVKVYEAMPPEDAAVKISAMDEQTAVEILRRMKSKKAGAVLTYMEAKRVASITQSITRLEKKFPSD